MPRGRFDLDHLQAIHRHLFQDVYDWAGSMTQSPLTPPVPPAIIRGRTNRGFRVHGLDGYDIGDQVGFLLRRAHQRHAGLFAEGMAAVELTPTQFNALVRAVELGAVAQNRLGRLAATDPATIQGVVRRLLARGLLVRRPDPADRRATLLSPTEAGRALAARAVAAARAVTDATLAPLDPADRQTFLTLLRRMT